MRVPFSDFATRSEIVSLPEIHDQEASGDGVSPSTCTA
jgi:hypothetical protein